MTPLARLQFTRSLVTVLCGLDVAVSTLLFVGVSAPREARDNIKQQVYHFNYGVSCFDIWLLSLLRVCLFSGLVLAFCFNRTVALRKLRRAHTPLRALLVIMFCYTVAKLLVSFEFYSNGSAVHGDVGNSTGPGNVKAPCLTNATQSANTTDSECVVPVLPGQERQPYHPWLWGFLGWTVLTIVLHSCLLSALTRVKLSLSIVDGGRFKAKKMGKVNGSINDSDDDEYTPLLSTTRSGAEERGGGGNVDSHESEGQGKGPSTISLTLRLLSYCKPDAHWYLVGFMFLVLSAIAMAFIPYYTGQVINHIAIRPSTSEFQRAILIMALVTITSAVCAGLRASTLIVANSRTNIRIRNHLYQSLVKQEIGFFDESQTGNLTSRLTSDTTLIGNQIGINLNLFLKNTIQIIGSMVFMVLLSWKLTVVTMVGVPVITVVMWYFGEALKNIARNIQDSFAEANDVAEETLSSMKTVRSFANEEREGEHYASRLKHTLRIFTHRKSIVYGSWIWFNNLLELALQVITLYYGGHLVIYNEITGGTLISVLLYQTSLTGSLDAIGSVVAALMQAVGASEKIFELIDRQPLIDHTSGSLKPDRLDGRVEFKNVCFSYPTRPDTPVLRGVSFTAQPGEVVALVGHSGGGKTSCISLLERFYEPDSGEILLDGRPLPEYGHSFLHYKLSLVGQEPVLFARTIADNISYGMSPAVTRAEVQSAAQMANAHGFISNMKDGYETQTGEKGIQLSGGQKQRVAIARALIRNPSVLLLDEATSALDTESEHLVQQALSKNFSGRTVILVAHRLSTVEKADKIIVIDRGRVVEIGRHRELLQRNGMYAKLVRKQMTVEQERGSGEE